MLGGRDDRSGAFFSPSSLHPKSIHMLVSPLEATAPSHAPTRVSYPTLPAPSSLRFHVWI